MHRVDGVDDVGLPGRDALRREVGVHVEAAELDRQAGEALADRALRAAKEGRHDLREPVAADPAERAVPRQPLAERERRGARAPSDLEDRGGPAGRKRPRDRLRAETIVDLVEKVVVREVVEPQRQSRGREEDLLARLLAAQEFRHVIDHRVHDGKRGPGTGLDRPGARLGRVGIAGRQRIPGAVHRPAVLAIGLEVGVGGELVEKPADRDLGARGPAARADDARRGRARAELLLEVERVHEAQDRLDRETVELLRAEDELVGEERADRGVRDACEQRVEFLRPLHHGRILVRPRAGPGGFRPRAFAARTAAESFQAGISRFPSSRTRAVRLLLATIGGRRPAARFRRPCNVSQHPC